MMKLILSSLIVLCVLLSQASAFTIMNIYVDEQGNAIFLGETDESPVLPLGININDGEITGQTSQLTSKSGELWTFSYSLSGAEINLILPEGATTKELSGGEISLDGDRISIFFQDGISVKYTIAPQGSSQFGLIIALAVIVLIIAVAYFYYKKKPSVKVKKIKKVNRLDIINNVLNDRERLVISKLRETGRIQSSRLRKILEMPKASFSRHVQELEKKNLVKRTGEGKNKFLELKS